METEGGAEELAATLFQCNMDGMDEKVAECMSSLDERVGTLEQATLSGEGSKSSLSFFGTELCSK